MSGLFYCNHPGFDNKPIFLYLLLMKTTIDLPDQLLEDTKIAAARRRSSIKNLVIEGLQLVLKQETSVPSPDGPLARLRKGYHLGGKTLSRDESHGR